MALYRISDLNIEIKTQLPKLLESLSRYEVNYKADPNVTLQINDDRLVELMEENEGYTADVIESTYLATLYSCSLFDFNGFPMRAIGVEHEGVCTLFAAPEDISVDLMRYIPEDKVFVYNFPGIRMEGDDYYVFDTPFGRNGHRSKTGRKLKLKSIVFVDSMRFDSLRELQAKDFVPLFMRAVAENIRNERTKHTLFVLERVMHRVKFYGLRDLNDFDFVLERVI